MARARSAERRDGCGLTYPLQCDVRFVATDAKLSSALTRRGVAPELGSHFLPPRVVGFSTAADLLLAWRERRRPRWTGHSSDRPRWWPAPPR